MPTSIPGGTDRLEREQDEAHRRYHTAFAALDRVVNEAAAADPAAAARLAAFQSLLIQFLQQITPYIDSKLRIIEQRAADAAMTATAAQRAAVTAQRAVERMSPAPSVAQPAVQPVAQPFRAAGTAAAAPSAASAAAAAESVGANPAADSTYLSFEDCFRGSEDEIRARQADYVALFAGARDVLDAGCGRGEFLSLLNEAGIRARGVDLNAEMVEACRARGLEAEQGDAVAHLRGLGDESLGGLFAAQVVEHLPPDRLLALLREASRVLRPGARLVLETINPSCWVAFFESFIRDLTHAKPLHPDTLKFLVVASGFTDVEVRFRTPVPEPDRLRRVAPLGTPAPSASTETLRLAELVAAFNSNMERLNDRLFTHLDYAIVARRA